MKWIDEIITGIKELYNSNDPYFLCKSLDIQIEYMEKDSFILRGNEASYLRSIFDTEFIYIQKDLDSQYEKFILAHELGHALLHTNLSTAAFNLKLMNVGKYERQATYFAFNLLDLELDSIELKGFSSEQIARTLHIPIECMDII